MLLIECAITINGASADRMTVCPGQLARELGGRVVRLKGWGSWLRLLDIETTDKAAISRWYAPLLDLAAMDTSKGRVSGWPAEYAKAIAAA